MQNEITDIKFIPVKKTGSHIGFISFIYNKDFAFNGQALHKILGKKNMRVLWRAHTDKNYKDTPICCPINRKTQQLIDTEVTAYVIANYGEL